MSNSKTKICMIEMPDLKFNDLSNAKLMKEACDETQKILSSIFNQKIEVVIWNTQIKFLGPNDLHGIIKGLQKIQKRTT